MSNEPMQQETVASLLSKQMPAIAKALEGGSQEERKARAERFARIALTTIRNNSSLMKCSPQSLISSLMQCASFDMEPDARGLVYLVPYKNEATFQLGYRGMIELAIRSGQVKSIRAEVVYRAEAEEGFFRYYGGTDQRVEHNFDILRPELRRGEVVGAYAVAEMANGTKLLAFVDKAHIDKRKAASTGARSNYSPWAGWEEEMCKKTAIKALCKTMPQSVEKLHIGIAAEDAENARYIDVKSAPQAAIESSFSEDDFRLEGCADTLNSVGVCEDSKNKKQGA